ncbi:hypothetical protein AGLY_004560 [Aphis glycines]|uniref:Uncharacterized protein n=1 Tax=Aphis glycines TaxID=307491 RepID=A0A6G0TYJ9_APHGL|nr:hypothetical protein AGLY_004560 [Aphis glycines]
MESKFKRFYFECLLTEIVDPQFGKRFLKNVHGQINGAPERALAAVDRLQIANSRRGLNTTRLRIVKTPNSESSRPVCLWSVGINKVGRKKNCYYLKEKYCVESMGPKETRRTHMNEELMQRILKSRRISWAGHVWRAECQIVHNITLWKPDNKRPRGRLRQRWSDRVRDDLKLMGIREGERLAKNR